MTTGTPAKPQPDGADPSMEEILASIRRILNEDEAEPAKPVDPAHPSAPASPTPEPEAAVSDDVLVLDESMMVSAHSSEASDPPRPVTASVEDVPPVTSPPPVESAAPLSAAAPSSGLDMSPQPTPPQREAPTSDTVPAAASPDRPASELVAPETAAAAATSLGSLVRTLSAGRQTAVYTGGPTLEDMVRAELRTMLKAWLDAQLPSILEQLARVEMRPMLKAWLDLNLPPMVEALVRAEIEKVVGRAAS